MTRLGDWTRGLRAELDKSPPLERFLGSVSWIGLVIAFALLAALFITSDDMLFLIGQVLYGALSLTYFGWALLRARRSDAQWADARVVEVEFGDLARQPGALVRRRIVVFQLVYSAIVLWIVGMGVFAALDPALPTAMRILAIPFVTWLAWIMSAYVFDALVTTDSLVAVRNGWKVYVAAWSEVRDITPWEGGLNLELHDGRGITARVTAKSSLPFWKRHDAKLLSELRSHLL